MDDQAFKPAQRVELARDQSGATAQSLGRAAVLGVVSGDLVGLALVLEASRFCEGLEAGQFERGVGDARRVDAHQARGSVTVLALRSSGELVADPGDASADAPTGLEAFNAGFAQRTGYEWLSRDEAEVDAYVADPWCRCEVPDDVIPSLFAPAPRLADPALLASIRRDLPILIASGDADPLAGCEVLVWLLGQRYHYAGVADVTVTLYPAAHHDILNETNRGKVTADIVAWLRAHVASVPGLP